MKAIMKNRILAAALAALVFSGTAGAQSLGFLNINSDPSVVGMGVVSAPGAFSAENNIAAVALSQKYFGLGFGYELWQPSTIGNHIIDLGAYGCIAKRVGIAINAKFKNSPEFAGTNNKGGFAGNYSPKENYIATGVSVKVYDGISIGAKYKFVSSDLWEKTKANAHAFDVSAMYIHKDIRAGLSVENLGGKVSYGNDNEYALPSLVKAGAWYKFLNLEKHGLGTSLEAAYMFAGDVMADVALVYNFTSLEVRGGYHFGYGPNAIASYASVGVGYEIKGFGLNLKYLFGSKTLANTMLIGVSYNFQKRK